MLQTLGNVARIGITLPYARRTRAHITASRTEPFLPPLLNLVVIFSIMLLQTLRAIRTETATPNAPLLPPHLTIGSPRLSFSTALNHITLPCLALVAPLGLPMPTLLCIPRLLLLRIIRPSSPHRSPALATARFLLPAGLLLVLLILLHQSPVRGHPPFSLPSWHHVQLCLR